MIKTKNKRANNTKLSNKKPLIKEEGDVTHSDNEKSLKSSSSRLEASINKKDSVSVASHLENKNKLKLSKLILENFKSFQGKHEIGYFLNFSVVLGPNGSGKSNIIDAICFALGMKTISLRTKNLNDLVNKSEEVENENQRKKCYVELIFIKEGDELSFKRTITSKGTSEFFFNNTKVSSEDYLSKLEDLDIPSKARYFILVQGAIDTMLSKKNDLTETVEFLSESYLYKEDYEKVKNDVKLLNEEISNLSSEMHSIKDDRNRVKTLIENEFKYNEIIQKLNKVLNKIYLFKLAEMDLIIESNENNLSDNENSLQQVQTEKKELIEFIKNKEFEIKKLEYDFKFHESDHQYRKRISEINYQLSENSENLKLYESQIFSKISLLNQQINEKKRKDEKKISLKNQTIKLDKEIQDIKNRINAPDNSDLALAKAHLSKSQIEEYRNTCNTIEIESFQINKEQEKVQLQLTELNNQKSIIEKNLYKTENEKISLENDIKLSTEKLRIDETNKGKLEIENLNNKNMLGFKQNEKMKVETELDDLYKQLNEKMSIMNTFECESYENVKKNKIIELMNRNPKVYGFLYELITPIQKKLETPIKISLLKYLNYLVVENSQTAKECSEYLKSKEINSDVLVLENLPIKDTDESGRLKLGNLGNFVSDLIDCKKKGLKNAMNYFLKDLVLCYDQGNLEKIKGRGFSSVITLDGTIYKKGAITGGSYKNLEKFTFNYSKRINNSEETEKIKNSIEILSKQVQSLESKKLDYREFDDLKKKIIENENSIEVHSSNLAMYRENINKSNSTLQIKEEQIQHLNSSLNKIESEYSKLNHELEVFEKQKGELRSTHFNNFIKKYNIPSDIFKDYNNYSLTEIKRLTDLLKSQEEKLMKINSQLKSIETNEEFIIKLEKSLNEEKIKKKEFELEKENLQNEISILNAENEKFLSKRNVEYVKISANKEDLKIKHSELDQIDKRIRNLLKNKIEFEHNIMNSIENKKNIIQESTLNMNLDRHIQELNISGNINENQNSISSVFVSFDVKIQVIASETKLNNKTNPIIDYTEIESKTKVSDRSIEEVKQKKENNKNKLFSLSKELEKYVKICSINEADSLKSEEEILNRKKKQTSLQVQNLVNELDKKKEEFEKIKSERKNKFENFFKKLSNNLASTYKELTKPYDSTNPGGTAYIYNTNEDEPYLGTVCYLPTPPGKRVIYDIDQLSGGEKTIAMLSLIISIQSICLTPFIILDEIDSYLDREHEVILENVFKTQNKKFQIIIVTHKSNIFRSAESLIGTYFNKQKFSSVPVSIDMTKIC